MKKFNELFVNRKPELMNIENYFTSAVLLPIIDVAGQNHILFEVRSKNLDRQPGEICFPGGAIDEGETPAQAALRETSEELGISTGDIELIGPLDYMVAPLGLVIYPFLGVIKEPQRITPAPEEVAEIFTVPLDYFLQNPPNIANYEVGITYGDNFPKQKIPAPYRQDWGRRNTCTTYYYEYNKYFIWGMTCRILVNFIKLMKN